MRVAFISTMVSAPWGGSEELWKGAALELKKRGHDVSINIKEWAEMPEQLLELDKAGCAIERRKYYVHPSLTDKILSITGIKAKKGGYYNIEEYLLGIKANLVVISQGSNQDGVDWMDACIKIGQRYVTISQAALEALWPPDELAVRLGNGFAKAVMNYFISENNLKLTIKQTAYLCTNSKVVRNPFNVPYNSTVSYPATADHYSLACVGRVQPDAKGHDILLEVLATDKWKGRPLKVNIYGRGPNLNSLKKLADIWDIVNVTFHGFVTDVSRIWEINQGLILPSRYEGLPLAVVEASLSGRISIVTDVAGNEEVIQDGITGFIAKAPNAKLLDEAMERAWSKRDEWKQMGVLAKQYVQQQVPEDPSKIFADELISLL